jgi:hypothetical protein
MLRGEWFDLLLQIHNSLKWRSDEISSGNSVNWFDGKLRNWSWVNLLIWSVCDLIETEIQMCEISETIRFWWNEGEFVAIQWEMSPFCHHPHF